ncbi:MAG: hypothetical protein JOZ43_01135 [Acidobacteriales bacterium]|nr:hypothetical protein [Terriglobales bacterium]
MFLAIVLLAAASQTPPQPLDQTTGTCFTMRTYILSKDPDHHIQRVLTCVPEHKDHVKRAGAALFVPVAKPGPDTAKPPRR